MNAPHGPSEQELVAQTLKTAPGMSWGIPGGNHGGKSIEQTLVRLRAAAYSLLDFFGHIVAHYILSSDCPR